VSVILLVAIMVAAVATMAILVEPATSGVVPSREILEMKYFSDLSATEQARAPDMSGILSEYALVTVDPAAFMHDADTDHEVFAGIRGTPFRKEAQVRIYLVSVPPPISPDAVLVIENESGEFVKPLPLIKQYKGVVMGREPGEAFFTVSDDVILGKMSVNGIEYYLEQRGPGLADGGKAIHILYRSDKTIPYTGPAREFDVHLPAGCSLMNLDRNQSHTVHILLLNATHTVGEEQFELAAGNRVYPDILTGCGDGTYSVRFTADANITSELPLIGPSGRAFLLNPNGTVTRDDVIFIE
jgi:hypothetical protein